MDYKEFLRSKQKSVNEVGFDIPESKLNKKLFDFQKFIVHINISFSLVYDTDINKNA